MKETDPVKYGELGAEIWQVLDERERFEANNPTHTKQTSKHAKAARNLAAFGCFSHDLGSGLAEVLGG
jgi:hypothetical protein